jgi:putative transposase
MSQCIPCEAAMTCLNPNAHHISVTGSQQWDWIVDRPKPRSLSAEGRKRYRWLRWHATHGENVSLTCRHHGISRRTFYRWQHRFVQQGLPGLEDRPHRPRRCHRPTWTRAQMDAVLALREQYPTWGKAKLAVLLGRRGIELSVSMVGRILQQLKQTGRLREALRQRRQTRRLPRPYAIRKPKDYMVAAPGDLVQVDTLDVAVTPGSRFKHLSLVDVISRWHTAEIRRGATAQTMRENLDAMRARLPFAVMAIQVDGGSEFRAEFERYCQEEGIRLFTLPPRSPKLNGRVERVQRTDREEFYACTNVAPRLETLQPALRAYEDIYNTIRPHQALGYLTPQEYLDQYQEAA